MVTRIWCTESKVSARTARSQSISSDTCAAMARCTLSVGSGDGSGASSPRAAARTLASFDPCPAGSAPASKSRLASRSSSSAAESAPSEPAPTSSSSHSRQFCSESPAVAVTRSSQNSASSVSSGACSMETVRSVSIRATGCSERSRTMANTMSRSSSGTLSRAAVIGSRTSVRASAPAGSFRCQPASVPPVRRRRVILCAARSWFGVSKYTASRCATGSCSTRLTADKPSNDGDTVLSTTANLRSISVWRDGLRLPAAMFTFVCDPGRAVPTLPLACHIAVRDRLPITS